MNDLASSAVLAPPTPSSLPPVDAGTIAWLAPEISSALDAAIAALRAFRGAAAGVDRHDVDLGPLRVARSHVHQAHGALEIVEIAGAPRLTDAIDALLALFEEAPARCDANALDAIVQASRTLVEYLEDLQGGEPQQPLYLFPSYRALQVARGAEPVHAADLFPVDASISPPRDPHGAPLSAEQLAEQRSAFEQALLRYLRDTRDESAVASLARAVTTIEASVSQTAKLPQQRAFWWITRALFEALAHGGLAQVDPARTDIKRLAGRVNLQIRKLVEGSPTVPDRLFADVLFVVALADAVTPHVAAVQELYRLHGSIPPDYEVQRYALIDAATLRRARDALGEAKHAWSSIVGGDVSQIAALARDTGTLLDAVTPLRRPGLVDVAHIVDGIATELGFDPRQPAPNVGLDVATALLFLEGALGRARQLDDAFDRRAAAVVRRVEASALGQDHPTEAVDWLDEIARKAEERLTMATFVGELQANLRHAEQQLDAFFREPNERGGLADALGALVQVSGALALLGHDDAHHAVDHAREMVGRFAEGSTDAGDRRFEQVAETLGAVGFYVEQLKRDRVDHDAFRFDATTGRFVAHVGRPDASATVTGDAQHEVRLDAFTFDEPQAAEVEATRPAPTFDDPSSSFAATEVLSGDPFDDDDAVAEESDAGALLAMWFDAPADGSRRSRLVAALEAIRGDAALIDAPALQAEANDVLRTVRDATASIDATARARLASQVATLVAHAQRAAGVAPVDAAAFEPSSPVPASDDIEAVDAELLEIFLEEAQIVLGEATSSLAVLDADSANHTALSVLRRGFHTLKGSSRMVGLATFGDAAWAIEDTLNGFLAEGRAAHNDLRSLVDYAIRYLADWVADLRDSGRSTRMPDALIEAARAVRTAGAEPASPGLRVLAKPDERAIARAPTEAAGHAAPVAGPVAEPAAAAPAAATDVPAEADDAFAQTVFVPRADARAPDAFAATQVFGRELDDRIDIEFFGVQPQLPTDSTAVLAELASVTPDAGFDVSPASTPASTAEPASDAGAMAFAKTEVLGDGPADDDESADGDDSMAFAKTIVLDGGPDDADAEDDARAFAKTEILGGEDESAAGYDAYEPTLDVPPLDFGVAPPPPAPTIPEPVSAIAESATAPAASRVDETRRIGSLTLSVALFNIYLSEADELLRVLTQDFAEWRMELDRFVSEGAMRAAHSLAGSSSTVGLEPAHQLASAIEEVLQQIWREPTLLDDGQVGLLQDAVESLRRMLHRFAAERMPEADRPTVAALLALRQSLWNDDPARSVSSGNASHATNQATSIIAPTPTPTPVDDEPFEALDFSLNEPSPAAEATPAAAAPAEPLAFADVVGDAPARSDADAADALADVESIDGVDATPALSTSDAELAAFMADVGHDRPADDARAEAFDVDASDDARAFRTGAIEGTGHGDTAEPTDDDAPLVFDDVVIDSPTMRHAAPALDAPTVDATDAADPTDLAAALEADLAADLASDLAAPPETRSATDDPAFASDALDATLYATDESAEGSSDAPDLPSTDLPTAEAPAAVAAVDVDGALDLPPTAERADDDRLDAVPSLGRSDAAFADSAFDDVPLHPATGDEPVMPEASIDAAGDEEASDRADPVGHAPTLDAAIDTTPGDEASTDARTDDAVFGAEADDATSFASPLAETADAHVVEADASATGERVASTVSARPPEAGRSDDVAAVPSSVTAAESQVHDEIDPELLDVFLAEGGEILPAIGELLRLWQRDAGNREPSRQLLRHLHTLKGSARMAGAMRLGEVVHGIETRVESAARLHEIPAALFEELLAAHDRSVELFDALSHPAPVAAAATTASVATDVPAVTTEKDVAATDVPTETRAADDAAPRARDGRAKSQAAVRISSETLDRLVNLAGEVSISRARVDNEVAQIRTALSDLTDNVERLRAQLREIELQAEFQLQSQMQSQMASGREREKFDPLEFDRFTRFQELTRMMAESVNDVKTVQQNLQKSLEGAESDLSSQRRMTRDLQQDLMRVRMVPFASIAERLYRVARRAAKELDKRVNLDIRGGSVEIDRGVLERMAGPFEHLLRNHIVHGVESRDVRRRAGKSETGELLVEVRQEGNEMVLTFSDDGAGLDHDRIRAKARALGLMGDDERLSDDAVAEFIFHPGFSTASQVTELAGRGVGMDVVLAEATNLAGRVTVDSRSGSGTRFTIHLPLTLAVTQVVLVRVASRTFALPAALVEQVQQLKPQPLADAYRSGDLDWLDGRVRLAFLGTLLDIDESVPVAQRSSPVLVLRSAGERIAVHVDEVIGNQEVVVKNLGPQLSRMAGIVGATVLGSGEIVLILNPVQLSGAFAAASAAKAEAADRGEAVAGAMDDHGTTPTSGGGLQTLPTVMVVDDSLTVRRVTQRLLSREGYQVILAKDGVDALEQLQAYAPDAMLVDIEMPRMDGFDLTRNVRNDPRYRDVPILMITSRTAEKHRQHAIELGVDEYLGKPYQEDELLELLARHVGARRAAAMH